MSTGLEKFSFDSNPKEKQGQKLLNYLIIAQNNAQNPSSQVSIVYELRISRCTTWIQMKQRNKIKLPTSIGSQKKTRKFQENIYFCFIDHAKAFYCEDHNKLWKILKEMGIPDHLTYLLRNLYAGQEATIRSGHGTTDWFQIGKGVCKDCML